MSSSRRGFTLVELLVALVIFVLVAGSLYRVLNVSQRAGNESEEAIAINPTNPKNIVIFTNIAEGDNGTMAWSASSVARLSRARTSTPRGNDLRFQM